MELDEITYGGHDEKEYEGERRTQIEPRSALTISSGQEGDWERASEIEMDEFWHGNRI